MAIQLRVSKNKIVVSKIRGKVESVLEEGW